MTFDWNKAASVGKRGAYKALTYDDIEEYCMKNNRIDWLINADKELMESITKKSGRKYTIMQLRNKFLTEVLGMKENPVASEMSIHDRIVRLSKQE